MAQVEWSAIVDISSTIGGEKINPDSKSIEWTLELCSNRNFLLLHKRQRLRRIRSRIIIIFHCHCIAKIRRSKIRSADDGDAIFGAIETRVQFERPQMHFACSAQSCSDSTTQPRRDEVRRLTAQVIHASRRRWALLSSSSWLPRRRILKWRRRTNEGRKTWLIVWPESPFKSARRSLIGRFSRCLARVARAGAAQWAQAALEWAAGQNHGSMGLMKNGCRALSIFMFM